MAKKTFKDMTFRIDNASGTLADITAEINQQALEHAMSILEDTAMSATRRSILPGLGSAKGSLNGFVDSTTDAIFGPLVGNTTSITKTVEFKAYANRFYNGEVLLSKIKYSGKVDDLETWSCDYEFDDAVNRTSVALA